MARPSIIQAQPKPLPDQELVARLFRTLGDSTRLAIVDLLLKGPLHQKDIVQAVALSQGQVSQHLACLTWCGFVDAERRGRLVEYRVADPRVVALVDIARAFLADNDADIAACRIAT